MAEMETDKKVLSFHRLLIIDDILIVFTVT